MSDALADQLESMVVAFRLVLKDLVERDIRIEALEAAIRDALALHAAGCGDAFQELRRVLEEPTQ